MAEIAIPPRLLPAGQPPAAWAQLPPLGRPFQPRVLRKAEHI